MDSWLTRIAQGALVCALCWSGNTLASESELESPALDTLKLPNKTGVSHYSPEFIEDTYLHFSLEHILSNHYEFATSQLETTGEFSNPDRYTFSFNGNSYKWNTFSMDNHRIDDVFFPGSSMHKIMLLGAGLDHGHACDNQNRRHQQ